MMNKVLTYIFTNETKDAASFAKQNRIPAVRFANCQESSCVLRAVGAFILKSVKNREKYKKI